MKKKSKNKSKNKSNNNQQNDVVIVLWIGAVVAGVASIVGALITANQTKKANEANIDNQNAMWEKTNVYNNPLQQRLRMEAAGFNPNLMAGAPQNTAQNQNMPDMKVPDLTGLSMAGTNAVNTFYAGRKLSNDTMKTLSDVELNTSKKGLTDANAKTVNDIRQGTLELQKGEIEKQKSMNAMRLIDEQNYPEQKRREMEILNNRISLIASSTNANYQRGEILRLQKEMWKKGINPSDAFMHRLLQEYGGDFLREWLGVFKTGASVLSPSNLFKP